MRGLKEAVLIFILIINISKAELDDDIITIEDETINNIENDEKLSEFVQKLREQNQEQILRETLKLDARRNKRILWPYPLKNSTERDTSIEENFENKPNPSLSTIPTASPQELKAKPNIRKKRILLWSYPQSPIAEMMMQTVAVNYAPINTNDPFDFLRDAYPLPKGFKHALDEYDYVIVGAGTSGSVLAARLSEEKPRSTVLVLEAGKAEMLLSDIPLLAPYMQLTDYSWPYAMEHQPGVCMGSTEQRCYSPRGKAIGGSSVTNNMVYSRGRPEDWDRIAADGNYGWTYDEVLKYFVKSERAELKRLKNTPYHGRDGELTVENVPFRTGLVEAFIDAGKKYNHPVVDYNAPDQLGFSYVQTTTNKGHRQSAAKAFLHPHKKRKNLHILSEARAAKVIIEPQTKRAYAVEYIRKGIKHTVRCRKEIILSAGPIASPQLLMLSGVGPQKHLETLGIPVIKDLSVGKSLYDSIGFPGVIFKLNSTNASLIEQKVATISNLIQWIQYGDSLLTSPGLIEGIGLMKSSLSKDPDLVPDIEIISLGGSITSDSGSALRKSMGISDRTYHHTFASLNNFDTWSAIPVLLHPKSRGYLELRDTNPFSHPKLFGNYLTDSSDIETLKEGVRHVIRLGQSEAFIKYKAMIHLGEYTECRIHPLGSDEYWSCAIKTLLISLHNQVGTCRMGPPNDPEAIVDPELRVYGVEGLRVVDTSVIPRTLSTSSTSGAAIMIGEKAADMIKRTWANVIS